METSLKNIMDTVLKNVGNPWPTIVKTSDTNNNLNKTMSDPELLPPDSIGCVVEVRTYDSEKEQQLRQLLPQFDAQALEKNLSWAKGWTPPSSPTRSEPPPITLAPSSTPRIIKPAPHTSTPITNKPSNCLTPNTTTSRPWKSAENGYAGPPNARAGFNFYSQSPVTNTIFPIHSNRQTPVSSYTGWSRPGTSACAGFRGQGAFLSATVKDLFNGELNVPTADIWANSCFDDCAIVTSSGPSVTSLNPRTMSSEPKVTSLDPNVASFRPICDSGSSGVSSAYSMMAESVAADLTQVGNGYSHDPLNTVAPTPIPSTNSRYSYRPPEVCALCKENKEKDFHHVLHDQDGIVRCPVLRKYVCKLCGATGDTAHTKKYCPLNPDGGRPPLAKLLKGTKRNSTGLRRNGRF